MKSTMPNVINLIHENPEEYDKFYDNRQGNLENLEIMNILRTFIKEGTYVLDLCCGTGLGYEFLKEIDKIMDYEGIDFNPDRIEFAKKKLDAFDDPKFIIGEAKDYLNNIHGSIQHIICLWGINYLNPNIIDEIMSKLGRFCIIIHYNKPFLEGSSSEYCGKIAKFHELHAYNKIKLMEKLEEHKAFTYRLLDQDYYYVSILKSDNK